MKLKTKIKWRYYNSLLSVFLISRFRIWLPFSIKEIQEISLMKEHLDWNINMLKKQEGENVSYSLKIGKENELSIYFLNSSENKILYATLCLMPEYNFNKSKIARWLCL